MLSLGQNAIVIGRFQGLHYAHQKIIETALHVAPNVIIMIGSINQPRTPRNPFTFEERRELILCNLQHIPNIQNRLIFIGLEDDLYNDNKWRLNFFEKLNVLKIDITKSIIVGSNKDSSSDFLKTLAKDIPLHLIDVEKTKDKTLYNATSIRKWLFVSNEDVSICQKFGASQKTIDWLLFFKQKNANEFIDLSVQFAYFQEYKRKLKNYPIICQATDAVVTKGNKILLITRGHYPGKNLLALPGGFVEENLTLETNCLKELQEETNMNISYDALRTDRKSVV